MDPADVAVVRSALMRSPLADAPATAAEPLGESADAPGDAATTPPPGACGEAPSGAVAPLSTADATARAVVSRRGVPLATCCRSPRLARNGSGRSANIARPSSHGHTLRRRLRWIRISATRTSDGFILSKWCSVRYTSQREPSEADFGIRLACGSARLKAPTSDAGGQS
jgi:hypothetical protein